MLNKNIKQLTLNKFSSESDKEEKNMFNFLRFYTEKIFKETTLKIFIEKVKHNFISQQIIITIFNIQFTVMRQVVFFKINERRIKNKKKYKNYWESMIVRVNIKYLKRWKDTTFIKKTTKIFNEMMHHEMTADWNYVFYSHMIVNKYFKTVLINTTKQQNDSFSIYNMNKIYCQSNINITVVKKWVKLSYKCIVLLA